MTRRCLSFVQVASRVNQWLSRQPTGVAMLETSITDLALWELARRNPREIGPRPVKWCNSERGLPRTTIAV